MDKYKKIKCVQGLIMSLDEQIYRYDQLKLDPEFYDKMVDQYYDAILEQLIETEKVMEDINEKTS
jgi:hypothetical protein